MICVTSMRLTVGVATAAVTATAFVVYSQDSIAVLP